MKTLRNPPHRRVPTSLLVRAHLAGFATSLCLASAAAASAQAPWPTVGWDRATPSVVGLEPTPLDDLHAAIEAGDFGLVDRVVVVRDGYLILDHRYQRDYRQIGAGTRTPIGCGADACASPEDVHPYNYIHHEYHPWYRGRDVHSLQSVTKSVAATVLAAAIHRGAIGGTDELLLSFFGDYDLDSVDPRLRDATLDDLLTMRSGIEWHEQDRPLGPTNTTIQLERSTDWIQFTLDQPMDATPGTRWVYNSGGSHLMSGVVRAATGRFIDEYAEEHLFGPLGIREYHWKKTPMGYPDTEGGLYLEALDLAKIGYLYLNDGVWEDERLLPEGWVEAATSQRVTNVNGAGFGYGYQWWRVDRNGLTIWAGQGFGGQFLLVFPELDIVAVANSWNLFGSPQGAIRDALADAVAAAAGR